MNFLSFFPKKKHPNLDHLVEEENVEIVGGILRLGR